MYKLHSNVIDCPYESVLIRYHLVPTAVSGSHTLHYVSTFV